MISHGHALPVFLEPVFLNFPLPVAIRCHGVALSVRLPVVASLPPSDLWQAHNQFAKPLKNCTQRTKGHVSY